MNTTTTDEHHHHHRTDLVSALYELDGHFLAGTSAFHELGLTKIAAPNVSNLRGTTNERMSEIKAMMVCTRTTTGVGLCTTGTARDRANVTAFPDESRVRPTVSTA